MIERFQFRTMLYVMLGIAIVGILLSQLEPSARSLTDIQRSGELRVLIAEAPDVYTDQIGISIGFDYDILRLFADELQVDLKLISKASYQLVGGLNAGHGDIIAGAFLRAKEPVNDITQSPTILNVPTVIAYQRGKERPKSKGQLEVDSVAYEERIPTALRTELSLNGSAYSNGYLMLQDLVNGKISTAMTTKDRLSVLRRYFPTLSIAFYPGSIAERVWYLPQRPAPDLYAALESFTNTIRENGDLKRISAQHFDTVDTMHYLDLTGIEKAIVEIMPKYLDLFREAAQKNNLDWELLAAISYQESHWNPDAVSPTGVRGIMQITEATAADLDLQDRTSAAQSIDGSAKYLAWILANIPGEIKGPERTKFLLASYNFGPEAVKQARLKTRTTRKNENYWHEVAQYGIREYALDHPFPASQGILNRGKQAEQYVKRVGIFRDILRYHSVRRATCSQFLVSYNC